MIPIGGQRCDEWTSRRQASANTRSAAVRRITLSAVDVALLDLRHGTCDHGLWKRYDALYRGGSVFRDCLADFLPRNPQEPEPVYQARCAEAYYCGYVGPIIDWFSARLLSGSLLARSKSPDGTTSPDVDPWYAEWKEDVDQSGTDLIDFLRSRFTAACVKGRSWWLVEKYSDGSDDPARSLADWEARNLGDAWVTALENEQVLDWETDSRGQFEWAVVHSYEQRRESVAHSRSKIREVWRVYDSENVETWVCTYDPSKNEPRPLTASLESKRKHGFHRVPLVRLGFVGTKGVKVKIGGKVCKISSSAMEGFWLMQRLADPQMAHFRRSAAMDWNLNRTCYAMPVFKLASDMEADGTERSLMGAGYYFKIGVTEDVVWVAPPTGHLSIMADRISVLKDEIYRVANQMAQSQDNKATTTARSGESKAHDTAATEVVLRVYGAMCREAVEATYELLSDARGDGVTWSVEGLDSFSMADMESTIAAATQAAVLDIPSPTFRRELAYRCADVLLPGLEQVTKDEIRQEIEEGVTDEELETPDMGEDSLEEDTGKGEQEPPSAPGSKVKQGKVE